MSSFMGNSLWHLITQSDAICKGILLLLLVLSIISWALFFYKLIILNTKKKELKQAHEQLNSVQNVDDLLSVGYRLNNTIGGHFINRNLMFLKSLLESAKLKGRAGLTHEEREMVRDNSYQVIDELVAQEESYMPFFSATAAAAPLIGLFGTVWGLIYSFVRISEKQSADIATVAPGIAEALITTMASLVIAIPALVMFVYLNTKIKSLDQQLVSLSDKFMLIANRLMYQ
ncbi:MAG: proton channel protein TolQ [Candidatus Babeliales bacterium]